MAAKEGWYRDPVAERWWDGSGWTQLTRVTGESRPDGPIVADNSDQPASWLPDPFTERYWDGSTWTSDSRPKAGASTTTSTVATSTATSPQSTAATTISSSPRSTPTSRRFRMVAIICGVVALLAVAIIFVLGFVGGDDTTSTDLEIPVGAAPVPRPNGFLRAQSGSPVSLSSASCGGLLAKISAINCIEATLDNGLHALAFVDDGVEIAVSVFRISTVDSEISAEQVLTGVIGASEELNVEFSVRAYILGLITGDAFALLVDQVSDDQATTTIEFIGSTSGDVISSLGIYRGSGADLAADFDRVYVALLRDADRPEGGSLVSTIYPAAGGWVAVEEVLASNELAALLGQREEILFQSTRDGFRPPETTTTAPPTTTTVPPTTTTIPSSGLIPGSAVSCDGSWIAIVSSQTFERTASAVSKFSGAYAVKNEDACASLNPTFSRGSDAGLPIYIVFYGPFYDRYDAQNQCLSLGRTTFSQCYVAPLTNNTADRSIRFGPTD